MPEMTGVEFLEKILPEYPETIRMILTGYSDIEAVIDAINKGQVYRYMNKPWDEMEMRMTIENARQLYGLKEEHIKSQFEALKNQVNPHFLFNNLNVLSSLIHIDKDAASTFVRQMSKVYRYVLEFKEQESIDLKEEITFLDSYFYLLKTRFGDNLQITSKIPDEYLKRKIVPMALQMLVENAIKHNVISNIKPLEIVLGVENDHLFVRNNLQKKSSVELSSGIGLQNIKRRYDFLTTKKVLVEDDENYFTVKIPLL
jgi:LytS/YehU family sensor histidine kinase